MVNVELLNHNDFKCLMGSCPSSCCEMWQIAVDENSLNYYNSLNTPYGEFIRENLCEEDGDVCFKVKGNRCAFLTDEGLCQMHSKIGAEHMAETCRKYPEFTVETQDYILKGQCVSCPYIAEKLLKNTDFTKLSVTGESGNSFENFIFGKIKSAIEIANEDIDFQEKTKKLLSFGEVSQGEIESKFNTESVFINGDDKNIDQYLATLNTLEVLTDRWKSLLERLNNFQFNEDNINNFKDYMKNRNREYGNILSYFIYKYCMGSADDNNFYMYIKFSVILTKIIYMTGVMVFSENKKFTAENQSEILYLVGKEIEHNEENLNTVYEDIEMNFI